MTLVELLVALAIASLLMLAAISAFQTTQRSAAIGEARENIYQNARVALDLMSKEIKNAYIDHRNRDFVLVSSDGLNGIASSILEYSYDGANYTIHYRGLGNAQTPHGLYTTNFTAVTDPTAMKLYADRTFGPLLYSRLSVKAIDELITIAPGPPDRLDFACFTSNLPAEDEAGNSIPRNESRLAEVRYMVTTESLVDDLDNDKDKIDHTLIAPTDEERGIDEKDHIPPGETEVINGTGLAGIGDMITPNPLQEEDYNSTTGKIIALNLLHLRRATQTYVNKNPFSVYGYLQGGDPNGRYPARNFDDFDISHNGESIGAYIYDLQFDFYGKIAIALDANGAPEVWGVGWGYQDVRGEDIGIDYQLTQDDDLGARAIQTGTVSVTKGNDTVTGTGTSWPSDEDRLIGGTFIVWPSSPPTGYTLDTADPANEASVYAIIDSASTTITLGRPYEGADNTSANYRIIEPTQANGVLDKTGSGGFPEDVGADGVAGDPLDNIQDNGTYGSHSSGIPNNVSNNDNAGAAGSDTEPSIGEGNGRLDSRVMGIWDSRSPDPRNPRRAGELNGTDDDGDAATLQANSIDDDEDGSVDDDASSEYGSPEVDDDLTLFDELNDLVDNDTNGLDGVADDRFYEPAGKPEGVDEPDEADPYDDSLPKAVRITIAVSDPAQTLAPVVLSTTVWLSTAR